MTTDRWTRLSEELLRGLVHAMNNRVTALSAFAELAAMDGEPLENDVLRSQITRLQGVSALIGVLATRNDEPEALELQTVLDVALAIHSHNTRTRSVPCTMEQSGAVLPVRVPRSALLRLLLIMIDDAKRACAGAGKSSVVIRLSGDEKLVRASIDCADPLGADATTLATECGGRLVQNDSGITLELPSLLELRRRERAAT